MPANGNIQNLTGLFSTNQVFEVPDFQRNYSWQPKNVEDFYTDINRARELKHKHFLGGLILLTDPTDPSAPIQVVDGQQRLTTIFLLIAQIRDAAARSSLPHFTMPGGGAPINPASMAQGLLTVEGLTPVFRFTPHNLVASLIRECVFEYPSVTRKKLPVKHFSYSLDLRKSFRKLGSLLDNDLKKLETEEAKLEFLYGLLMTIRFDLEILNVQTDTQSEAHEIFMTLNSRGLPLGPADLVKSEIFKHLTRGMTGKQLELKSAELSGDWKSIVDSVENGDIDQFLRHYLVSTRETSVTSRKVFDVVSRQINGAAFDADKAKTESKALLTELVMSASLYSQLLNGVAPGVPGADQILRLLSEVLDSYRIFLLVVVDPRVKIDQNTRLELIRLTEVIAYRWVLTGGNAQELEDLFQKLAFNLRFNKKTFEELKQIIKTEMPSDDKIRAEFEETYESAALVRVVMFKLNAKRFPAAAIPYDPKKLHVEHIAPDKSTEEWLSVLFPNDEGVDREVEYEAAVELWGNKLLLDAKINQSVKQKDFLTKARGLDAQYSGYCNSTIQMTVDIGNNLNDWSRAEIALRNKWVADSFLAVWSVDEDLSALKPYSEWRAAR
jgi:hypothetical protein